MKYYSLAFQASGKVVYLHPITGSVHQGESSDLADFASKNIPSKILQALEFCDYPYNLQPKVQKNGNDFDLLDVKKIKKYYRYIRFFRGINFLSAIIFSSFRNTIKLNSNEILYCFGSGKIKSDDHWKGCLNRVLTVAKLSNTFKEDGVIFIGIQMPLKNMHAWIIEKNYQPDPNDREWINFKPIAAYVFPE